jgi:hypothetical protein
MVGVRHAEHLISATSGLPVPLGDELAVRVLRSVMGQSVPGAVERSAAMPVCTTAATNSSVISASWTMRR